MSPDIDDIFGQNQLPSPIKIIALGDKKHTH
jgi:hypothetical protein